MSLWRRIFRFFRSRTVPVFVCIICTYSVFFVTTTYVFMTGEKDCFRVINPFFETGRRFHKPPDAFLLVAVMTTRAHLKTRAEAVYKTWGEKISGNMVFFVGDGEPYIGNLSVVILKDVTDTIFPPQMKSFSMIKYVINHFINDYEWFMRCDDDVFVKSDKLEVFLHSINSSKLLYVGHPGYGLADELYNLGMKNNEAFCMGGPGVFFTRSTLQHIKNNISDCALNTATLHEDTEIGRCVQKYAEIQCTNAYDLAHIFFQNYKNKSGSYTHQLGPAEERAITLHPVKQSQHMYRLQSHFSSIDLQLLRRKLDDLSDNIRYYDRLINRLSDINPSSDTSEVRVRLNELNGLVLTEEEMEENVVSIESIPDIEWEFINGKTIFSRYNVHHHPEVSLDQGFKAVARSAAMKSIDTQISKFTTVSYQRLSHGKIMENIVTKQFSRKHRVHLRTIQGLHALEWRATPYRPFPIIWMILPLYKHYYQFVYFISMIDKIGSNFKGMVNLQIILFQDLDGEHIKTNHFLEQSDKLSKNLEIEIIHANGSYSKAKAISLALEDLHSDALLLFMDIDVDFDNQFLHRVVHNTIYNQQVYFPISFRQFDPKIVCFDNVKHCNLSLMNFDVKFGSWNQYGFGILSIYKIDLLSLGILHPNSRQFDGMDVYEQCVHSNLNIFRVVDASVTRLYREKHCDLSLPNEGFYACVMAKRELSGNEFSLFKIIEKLKIKTYIYCIYFIW